MAVALPVGWHPHPQRGPGSCLLQAGSGLGLKALQRAPLLAPFSFPPPAEGELRQGGTPGAPVGSLRPRTLK